MRKRVNNVNDVIEYHAIIDYIGINPDCDYDFIKDESPDWRLNNNIAFEVRKGQSPNDQRMWGNGGPSYRKLRDVIDKYPDVDFYVTLESMEKGTDKSDKKQRYKPVYYRFRPSTNEVEIDNKWCNIFLLPESQREKLLNASVLIGKVPDNDPINGMISSFEDKIKDINDPNYRSFQKYILWVYHSLCPCDSRKLSGALAYLTNAQKELKVKFDEIYLTSVEGTYLFDLSHNYVYFMVKKPSNYYEYDTLLEASNRPLKGTCLKQIIKEKPSLLISKSVIYDGNKRSWIQNS